MFQKTHEVSDKPVAQLSMAVETERESLVLHRMKSVCLLRRKEYHTTAWVDSDATKVGLLVEIPELGGLWEIVEIYPYRLSDKQLKTRRISTVNLLAGAEPHRGGLGVPGTFCGLGKVLRSDRSTFETTPFG